MASSCHFCSLEATIENSIQCNLCLLKKHFICMDWSQPKIKKTHEASNINGMIYLFEECSPQVKSLRDFIIKKLSNPQKEKNVSEDRQEREREQSELIASPKNQISTSMGIESPRTTDEPEIKDSQIETKNKTHLNEEEVIARQKDIEHQIQHNSRSKEKISVKNTKINKNICKWHIKSKCKYGNSECMYEHPKICQYYKNTGTCRYGKDCKFHHIEICSKFSSTGTCKFGYRCKYFHPNICKFFVEGKCKKSKKCTSFTQKF